MRLSKWRQYLLLKDQKEISSSLPETHKFSKKKFWEMLEKYDHVVIKPIFGSFGRKIFQVTTFEKEQYQIHHEKKIHILKGKEQTYRYFHDMVHKKSFLIQQMIPLATINNCPFVVRVMVQRKKNSSKWFITGVLANLACEGYFITNETKKILTLDEAILQSSISVPLTVLKARISSVIRPAIFRFQTVYPSCLIIGFDIGIDCDGIVWIIEANFNPVISMFQYLEDKSMYNAIIGFINVNEATG